MYFDLRQNHITISFLKKRGGGRGVSLNLGLYTYTHVQIRTWPLSAFSSRESMVIECPVVKEDFATGAHSGEIRSGFFHLTPGKN